MGPTALLPLRLKACWGFFRPKNPTVSAGFEPANLGSALPLDHRSRLHELSFFSSSSSSSSCEPLIFEIRVFLKWSKLSNDKPLIVTRINQDSCRVWRSVNKCASRKWWCRSNFSSGAAVRAVVWDSPNYRARSSEILLACLPTAAIMASFFRVVSFYSVGDLRLRIPSIRITKWEFSCRSTSSTVAGAVAWEHLAMWGCVRLG